MFLLNLNTILCIHIITDILQNITGQAVIEKSNTTLEGMLFKQKGVIKTHRNRVHNVLLTLIFLNFN